MYQIKHILTEAVLFEADFVDDPTIDLRRCVMLAVESGADLRFAYLSDAYLRAADMRCANLSRANLSRANLICADLSGANLICADLIGAYLSDAYLRAANLICANLICADLSGANLICADLNGAHLSDANLSRADLLYVDLSGADLSGANLIGANLNGANLHSNSIIDAGKDARGYRFVAVQHDTGPMIAAGCRWFTLDEAKVHWDAAHADDPILRSECIAKVSLIEAIAKARGWIA